MKVLSHGFIMLANFNLSSHLVLVVMVLMDVIAG
jgi:hypothetical protein